MKFWKNLEISKKQILEILKISKNEILDKSCNFKKKLNFAQILDFKKNEILDKS